MDSGAPGPPDGGQTCLRHYPQSGASHEAPVIDIDLAAARLIPCPHDPLLEDRERRRIVIRGQGRERRAWNWRSTGAITRSALVAIQTRDVPACRPGSDLDTSLTVQAGGGSLTGVDRCAAGGGRPGAPPRAIDASYR